MSSKGEEGLPNTSALVPQRDRQARETKHRERVSPEVWCRSGSSIVGVDLPDRERVVADHRSRPVIRNQYERPGASSLLVLTCESTEVLVEICVAAVERRAVVLTAEGLFMPGSHSGALLVEV